MIFFLGFTLAAHCDSNNGNGIAVSVERRRFSEGATTVTYVVVQVPFLSFDDLLRRLGDE